MASYKVPMRDMQFLLDDVLCMDAHYQSLPGCEEATPDMVEAILEQGAKFAENEIAPINQSGDKEGCHFADGQVTTPTGYKEAYQTFVESGWPSLAHSPEWGGQGLPESLGIIMNEILGTANWAWSMYPGLSHGAMNTLEAHGTQEQKQIYLTKLVSGEWTGTMCLTEPHCGTDLGLLKTKAMPNDDDSYTLSGTKIFISAGEHDLTRNIVHIVLARLPDAPEGTKGISLFIVPKFLPDSTGEIGTRNAVSCGSIEHKMGIHGNATCVLNFDNATGFLIGPAHKGLNCMFTFMNTARIGTALQGLAHAEWGFQNSLAYAKERLQMRALNGAKYPDKPADPILVHPPVRELLLTQKAFAEGGRALIYFAAQQVDRAKLAQSEDEKKEAEDLLSLLTPIAKAFLTEVGFESANHAVQVLGGHGYIQEWGLEQNVRDARIAMIYEGTTQIQSLDLLGRKVLMTQGELLKRFTKIIHKYCQSHENNKEMQTFTQPLSALNKQWGELTMQVGLKAMKNKDEVGGAAVQYLHYSGYITLAWLWAMQAEAALNKLAAGTTEPDFYAAKIKTAKFYYARLLPRTESLARIIEAGVDSLMEHDDEQWLF